MNFNGDKLYPYQIASARHLLDVLESRGSALDGSDCGVGKTPVAVSLIRHFNVPTVVLPPKISLTAWAAMGKYLGTEFDVVNIESIRTGKTLYGYWENPKPEKPVVELICNKCQLKIDPTESINRPCAFGGIHCVVAKKVPHNLGKFYWNDEIKFLVFDEVHRHGAMDSQNADMLIAAKRQGIRTLAMSATAADSPLGLRALGYILGLHGLVGEDNFYRFAFKHGCKKAPFGGLYFAGTEEQRRVKMAELHRDIFPACGSRVRIAELGDAFPSCSIHAELYDFGPAERTRVESLYREMDAAIKELHGIKAGDVNEEHPLTKILRARQELELLKVPMFEEIAREERESGNSVVIFVAFKATVAELCKRLKVECRIVGGQSQRERDNAIGEFQSNREKTLVANIDAGNVSVSLHDLHGGFPRVGIFSPIYSSVKTRQMFGRLRRAGGKSPARYRGILAAGTCEEKIHRALSAKLDNLDMLNDGDLMAANLPLTRAEWPESL
jgi:hypothetical protein